MKNIKEIIEELNSLKIIQKSMDFTEDLDQDILDEYFTNNCVAELLDVDKHRWYETSTQVYELPDGYLGVQCITDVVVESNSVEDMFWELIFFEMEQVQTVSYRVKK